MPNPQRLTRKPEVRQQGTLNPWPRDVTHPLFQGSDFFAPRDLLQVKCEMLRQVRTENQAISQAALAFGFSRPLLSGARGLRSRRPAGVTAAEARPPATHKLTAGVTKFLAQARAAEPSLPTP
jgi:hypothetical protein